MMGKRLFNNNWVVRLVSLFFAILLTIAVSNGNSTAYYVNQTSSSISTETSVTISNVPVVLGEHDEGTFVSGMPETVSVRLSGPRNIVNQLSVENFSVSTESLVGVETGVKAIRLIANGLPESVEYKVTPDIFYGTISRKETQVREVEYEISEQAIASGYTVTSVELNPSEITLTGADTEMNKIDRVVVQIAPSTPQTETFTQEYRVQILDASGNPLDINASETMINVTVEVTATTPNHVSLLVVPIGEDERYDYSYSILTTPYIELAGDGGDVTQLNVLVDVTDLQESDIVLGEIEVLNNMTVTPKTVEVAVDIHLKDDETTQEETTLEHETTTESSES